MRLNNSQLKFFANFIETHLGIVYEETNYFQLEQRLDRIAQALGISDVLELYTKATTQMPADMKTLLLDIATNNETSFFRDPKVFSALETTVIPSLRTKFPQATRFRFWSAASSTGQEPYSIAMIVDEFMAKNPGHPSFELMATDISESVLKKAKEGVYSQLEVQRGLPAARMVKYFKKLDENMWQLRPDVANKVQFSKFNLLDSPAAFAQFHVIFCRYVLIYQDATRKKRILNSLIDCLLPGGYIFLGGSESTIGLTDRLQQVASEGAIYYERK